MSSHKQRKSEDYDDVPLVIGIWPNFEIVQSMYVLQDNKY